MEAAPPPVHQRQHFDRRLFGLTLFLMAIGTVIILDASFARALQSKGSGYDPYFFFKRQAMWVCLAGAVLAVGINRPYWLLRDWKYWLLGPVISITLLVLVLIPHIGIEVNGARRWLGFGPVRFQPSEFAKITVVLFLARYSEFWRGRISHLVKGFIPPVLMVLLVGALVAKEDLGTAITIITTGMLMIYMMGARPRHMVGLVGVAVLAGIGFILIEPYRLERISAWLDLIFRPLANHDGTAYQPAQGLIAVGSGGVWGKGIGFGTAKHLYLPAEHTDYIFATVGEETGLIGTLFILGVFGAIVVFGLTVAHRTRDWFGSMVAAGMTSMIGVQALLNIAVVIGLLPCTGVPLPFISYGGSSVVFTTLAVAIVLNISQYPNYSGEAKAREPREDRADGWRHRRAHLSST
jgi:cell division protein FtsW